MTYYCTFFDKNYLFRGVALYNSLHRYLSKSFVLYIICLDKETRMMLNKLDLKQTKLIPLTIIEDRALLSAKKNRTWQEYCWTITSSIIDYLLVKNKFIPSITYLDADLFFFSSPKTILAETTNADISIISHRFPPYRDFSQFGEYCVEYLTFKNNANALKCLRSWKRQCLNWCYNRLEKDRFGDQKYLDKWPKQFKNVAIIKNLGAGLAPWNITQYRYSSNNNIFLINKQPLVFYHFHSFKIYAPDLYGLASEEYEIPKQVINHVYQPYIKEIKKIISLCASVNPNWSFGYTIKNNVINQIANQLTKFKFIVKRLIYQYGKLIKL